MQTGEDSAGVATTRGDSALVKVLGRAFRWRRILEEGRHASISELAAAEEVDRGYLGRVLRLTLLAPDIVEAILDGDAVASVRGRPQRLAEIPPAWEEQRRTICRD